MPDLVYRAFKQRQAGAAGTNAAVDFDADTIRLMLVTATYVTGVADATKQTHAFIEDVTAVSGAEVSGTGYSAGGATLTGKAVTLSGNNYIFTCTNPSWANSTFTARGAVMYKDTGAAATSPLIALYDFGADVTSNNGTFTVQFAASGALEFA